MMTNKEVIETYIDGFNKSDHEQILSCLTDDVIWEMPGLFYKVGKEAFDKKFDRRLGEGTFALQAHDPDSTVYFRNLRVKRMADK